MTTLTKSRFARRSLVLCGVAGAVVIWLMLGLVNIQLVSPRKTGGLPSGGILEREVLRPQRGRIMDANEEILTNNMHSSILVADGYHLSDPKVISYALAYSKAVHSPLWAETKTEKDQEKLVSGFRRKILNQAASKKNGSKEYNLAKILLQEPEEGPEGADKAQKRMEELYDPATVQEYVQAHLEYAARVIAPFLPDMSVQDIISAVEKDGEIPKGASSSPKTCRRKKRNSCAKPSRTPASGASGLKPLPNASIPCRNAWCTFSATSPRRKPAAPTP